MADLNYELAPTPGTPASVRKSQLDAARYVAVRNLAHMVYKKPDGSSLMTFGETLDERDRVKMTIIGHEISLGLLVNDIQPGMAPAAPVPQAAPQQVAPAPQMTPAAAAPPNGAPQYVPQMAVPPPVSPQAAAAVGAGPQEQAAPQAVPTRKRRTAAGVGAAVAPPPASPQAPPMQQEAPASFGGAMAMAQPQASFVPPQMTPQASFVPAAFTPPSGPAPVQQPMLNPVGNVDLTPVLAKLDQLGAGLAEIAKDGEQLKAENAALKKVLNNVFAAIHHIYMVDPTLAKDAEIRAAGTLVAFEAYLSKFTGNPK
jgi:hypothetical protein